MFKTGHALPLAGARLLRPRSSRGEHAGNPREMSGSGPRAWQIHDLDSVENRTCPRPVRVREQSASAFNPHKQACPRTVRVFGNTSATIVCELATAMDSECPQIARSLALSTSANSPYPRTVRERGLANHFPRRCITVSIFSPVHFPVRIQIIPAYDLV